MSHINHYLRIGIFNHKYFETYKLLPSNQFIKFIPVNTYNKKYNDTYNETYNDNELINNNGHIFLGNIKKLNKYFIPTYFTDGHNDNGSEKNLLFYNKYKYKNINPNSNASGNPITDITDITELVKQVKQKNINFQFIIDEDNEIQTHNKFYKNIGHKQMILKSLSYNNLLPHTIQSSILTKNTHSYNTPINIRYTSLKYKNNNLNKTHIVQNHIFNYNHHYNNSNSNDNSNSNSSLIYKSGSYIAYDDLSYMGHHDYDYNNYHTISQNIEDYILNIRNGLIIKNNEDLYWKLEFISKLCDISLNKDICIEIPETITYDEIGDFIDGF
jgi:hypothetical protein